MLCNEIKELSNLLDKKYNKEFNFRNHCYLRIAYGNTISDKWDNKINKPFVKYADETQLIHAVGLLNKYVLDKEILLLHNEKSLDYRRKHNKMKKVKTNTLF